MIVFFEISKYTLYTVNQLVWKFISAFMKGVLVLREMDLKYKNEKLFKSSNNVHVLGIPLDYTSFYSS